MKLKTYVINEKGLSLVEILASFVLLTIVFALLSHFIFQASIFTTKVEAHLTTINSAEKVLNDVKTKKVKYTGRQIKINKESVNEVDPIKINGKTYYPYVSTVSETPEVLQLERVHVQIFSTPITAGTREMSPIVDLYGYKDAGDS
ncbi:hypothetical protein [Sporosarcina gallistercoris]|uniref:Prepilin-type N-terminal cleavage/methylation domain-containing protein n=1 Tax=Sporosarcina gallistercoris TaxID=2762245 RepID=A0ABR8PLP9_9BACL|nr:hypothetical protein [Sporosarcina gallistercoris]MBD7909098.1 hypothetical protein [Sporosarcina gallistercoris]